MHRLYVTIAGLDGKIMQPQCYPQVMSSIYLDLPKTNLLGTGATPLKQLIAD